MLEQQQWFGEPDTLLNQLTSAVFQEFLSCQAPVLPPSSLISHPEEFSREISQSKGFFCNVPFISPVKWPAIADHQKIAQFLTYSLIKLSDGPCPYGGKALKLYHPTTSSYKCFLESMKHSGPVHILSALIDSSAAGNFIKHETKLKLKLSTHPFQHPLKNKGIDGDPLESALSFDIPNLSYSKSVDHNTSQDHFLPGHGHNKTLQNPGVPWMQCHDPQISWYDKKITRWFKQCHHCCLHLPHIVIASTTA